MDEKAKRKRRNWIIAFVIWAILGTFFLGFGILCKNQINAGPEDKIEPFCYFSPELLQTLSVIFIVLSIPLFIAVPIGIALFYVILIKGGAKAAKAAGHAINTAIEESERKEIEEANRRGKNEDGTSTPTLAEIRLAIMGIDTSFYADGAQANIKTEIDMSFDRRKVTIIAHIYYKITGHIKQDEFYEFSKNVYNTVVNQLEYRLHNDVSSVLSFTYTIKVKNHM